MAAAKARTKGANRLHFRRARAILIMLSVAYPIGTLYASAKRLILWGLLS